MKGIIPINKPKNWTSFDVVNKCKRLLKISKVGHLGTLDPMATGVLLVTVGKATKLFDFMQQKQKTYVATFKFGYETDTLDLSGQTINTSTKIPTTEELNEIIPTFGGKQLQVPPKYSAKSVNGKRAYELARSGVDFELKAKEIEIFSLEIINYNKGILKLKIVCGSGTYIRSLGRDIAYKLDTFATMTELERIEVGNFPIESCKNIDELTDQNINNFIIPIKSVLNMQQITIESEDRKRLLNGQTLQTDSEDGIYMLNDELDTLALVKVENNLAKMSVFLG